MLASLIIVLRESLEAGLAIAIVMAAVQGIALRARWVSFGIVCGMAGAALIAGYTEQIDETLKGIGHETVITSELISQACLLAWLNIGEDSFGSCRRMAPNPRLSTILTLVVILAVLREGTEIIEFLNGIASSDGSTPANIALGGLIGVGMATGVSSLFYRALTCLSERLKLRLTAGMVTILAASLSLEAWNTLRRFKGTTIPGRPLWDSSPLLSETSLLGRILHTILGYTAAPTGGQMAVYVAVLVAIPTFASIVRKGKHRRD